MIESRQNHKIDKRDFKDYLPKKTVLYEDTETVLFMNEDDEIADEEEEEEVVEHESLSEIMESDEDDESGGDGDDEIYGNNEFKFKTLKYKSELYKDKEAQLQRPFSTYVKKLLNKSVSAKSSHYTPVNKNKLQKSYKKINNFYQSQ